MLYEDHTQEPKDIGKTPIHSWRRASQNGKLHSTGFLWSHRQLHCPCQEYKQELEITAITGLLMKNLVPKIRLV